MQYWSMQKELCKYPDILIIYLKEIKLVLTNTQPFQLQNLDKTRSSK